MNILGMFGPGPNPSATLLINGIIVNTSFNIQGEPIVCTPRDAIRTFGATGLDALAIGNYIIRKE